MNKRYDQCLVFWGSVNYGEYDGVLGGWVNYLKWYFHGGTTMAVSERSIF
ncbi:hypothetical protein [Riemerella columbipharyngis]|nr:hypothetical protein [Riemerella columbipharyngis]